MEYVVLLSDGYRTCFNGIWSELACLFLMFHFTLNVLDVTVIAVFVSHFCLMICRANTDYYKINNANKLKCISLITCLVICISYIVINGDGSHSNASKSE